MNSGSAWSELWKKEDYWAIWLAMGLIFTALIFFAFGSSIKPLAVKPAVWDSFSSLGSDLVFKWPWYALLCTVFLAIFTLSAWIMGYNVRQYIPGFLVVFMLSAIILIVSSYKGAKDYNIEAPFIALVLGLLVGNFLKMPSWLDVALRTEYYIKTGIILLGATLPVTIIISAGPIAMIQAAIVSITTFLTIFFVATRVFKMDKKLGACMGAGGSVCGVSASIAVGGAVDAKKEHIAISISLVVIWAIVMIFSLPIFCRFWGLDAGVSGAWIGTSEFADAAGFAAAASLGDDRAIYTYSLVKVIGRDVWIGMWAFILAIISIWKWDREGSGGKANVWDIWHRFPKFVLGFLVASVLMSLVALSYKGEAFANVLKPEVITPIKTLRTWTFIFTFLSIGLSTRFRELKAFGWRPFLAFTIGVIVNVPLGYLLSEVIFKAHWIKV